MTLTYNLHMTVHLNDMKLLVKSLEKANLTISEKLIGTSPFLTKLVIKSKKDIKPNDILRIGSFIGLSEHIALNH